MVFFHTAPYGEHPEFSNFVRISKKIRKITKNYENYEKLPLYGRVFFTFEITLEIYRFFLAVRKTPTLRHPDGGALKWPLEVSLLCDFYGALFKKWIWGGWG